MQEQKEKSLEEIEQQINAIKNELESGVHGTETEVYARIVGYYRAVKNWNKGKRDEFESRKAFVVEGIDTQNNICSHNSNKAEAHVASKLDTSIQKTVTENIENDYGNMYFEIFTKKTCPNCPPVKEFMKKIEESYDISGRNIDVDTEEGLSEAASKGVFASPTVILYSNGKEISRGHSVEELSSVFEFAFEKTTC